MDTATTLSAQQTIQARQSHVFIFGLCFSFAGVIFALLEVSLAYKVLQLEVRVE